MGELKTIATPALGNSRFLTLHTLDMETDERQRLETGGSEFVINILAGKCRAAITAADGGAVDLEDIGRRSDIFAGPPELIYLTAGLGAEKIKAMHSGRCPYNIDGRCSVYEHRFAGCRIFCCEGDAGFQSELSESALARLKSICTEFEIPYRYLDLATTLNTVAGI